MVEPPISSPELDGDLRALVEVVRAGEDEVAAGQDFERMLATVSQQIETAERNPGFWLQSRSTAMRRSIGFGAALLVFIVGGVMLLRHDFESYPAWRMALSLGAMGVLFGLALWHALRPLHVAPLTNAQRFGMSAVVLLATCALAVMPSPHGETLTAHVHVGGVMPCLMYGLLMGLPVYFVLRVLDRARSASGALLAACAAGLLGNITLQMHCPNDDPIHLLTGHFSVVLMFVIGLTAVHYVTRAMFAR